MISTSGILLLFFGLCLFIRSTIVPYLRGETENEMMGISYLSVFLIVVGIFTLFFGALDLDSKIQIERKLTQCEYYPEMGC